MNALLKDLRFAVRGLLKRPAFTVVVVLTLALGIGANTAIFSVVNALLFKSLPYPEADRLFALTFDDGKTNGYQFWSYPKYAAFKDIQSSFTSVAAYEQLQITLGVDQPRRTEAEIVTPNYFEVLGVHPLLGATFSTNNQVDAPSLLLGHEMWQRDFGSDTQLIGRTVLVNNQSFVIAGVLPPNFRGQTGTVECWLPMSVASTLKFKTALTATGAWWLKVIGRLKPGRSREQAVAEMSVASGRVAEIVPTRVPMLTERSQDSIRVVSLRNTKVDPAIRKSFLILQAVVVLLLAIACANTANLMLARSISRQKEFAVRMAIGGSRLRLIRLILVESLLLGLGGGVVGVVIATWVIQWMTEVRPLNTVGFWSQYAQTFDYFSVTIDWQLLFFNFLIALLIGVLFGIFPAWRATKPTLNDLLKRESARSDVGFRALRRLNLRSGLVVTEIALSLVLLAGAGLLLRSFARVSNEHIGFQPTAVMTTTVVSGRQSLTFYQQLLERIQGIPGVEKASLSLMTPLSGTRLGGMIEIEGQPQRSAESTKADINVITEDYFETFRTPMIKGRSFSTDDRIGSTRVAVVSKEFAARYFPGQEALGQRINTPFRHSYGDNNSWIEIVGVVDDVKYGGVDEVAQPTLYLPAWQPLGTPQSVSFGPDAITIRSSVSSALVAEVQKQVRELDRSLPLYGTTMMEERVAQVTARYRYTALFVTLFALVAVALAAIGIYGVMSFTVASSTREVGIRMALGSPRSAILKLIITHGLLIVLISLCLGLPGAFVAVRVLDNQLYQVSSRDPVTFIFISLLVIVVAIVGCLVPGLRAIRLDPMSSLREE